MKFNYEKYPVLEKLDKGIFGVIGINPDHSNLMGSPTMNMLRDTFKMNIPYFKSSIKYVASTLNDAIMLSKEKLLTPEINMRLSSCCGTIIGFNGLQYCYNIIANEGEDDWQYVFYAFYNNELRAFYAEDGKKAYGYTYEGYSSAADLERARMILGHLILILNFLKYADTQTKIAEPGRPIFEGVNCLYNNKSKTPIQIIDSTWLTTLVKSDAFKVRGHFRLQPHGHGLKDRKLIWINEFQKEGYTREAKILHQSI